MSTETERRPDTVTFQFEGWTKYVVSGKMCATESVPDERLASIDLFAEGEFVAGYSAEDSVPREDLDLIVKAAAVAGVSVASLSEMGTP